MRTPRILISLLLLAVAAVSAALSAAVSAAGAEPSRVAFRQDDADGQMQVLIDGREAFVYQYGPRADLVHLYPIRSPGGKPMTVQHPNPYPHHRSFWFADKVRLEGERTVEFYGALYSGASRQDPKPPFKDHVRHVEFIEGPTAKDGATKNEARGAARLLWEMDSTKPVLDERRDVRIVALADGEYFVDVTFTLTASYGNVEFVSDAVHYAWPYVRMNTAFSVDGGGVITNSEGGRNQQGTHNQVARWVDYSNTVDGESAGLAVFSHSDNPQPHRWLTRDYGCFGPRRIDAKSGKPFTLKKGQSISQRIGVLVHRGDATAGTVAKRYEQYVAGEL